MAAWRDRSPYLLLALAMLFWSGNFVLGRGIRAEVPPVGLAFWRWAVAFLVVMVVGWPQVRADLPLMRRHWRMLALLALLGIATFNTFVYLGLRQTTAINGLLMQSTMPVMIVALSLLIFREGISWRQGAGVGLSLAGVATIITQGQPQTLLGLRLNGGDLLILLAVLCYSGYSVLLKRRPPLQPFALLAVTFGCGAVMLLPFYLWETLAGNPMQPTLLTALAVGYVSLFPSILAYLCYNRGVAAVGANRAGLFFHLMPAFGSLLAMLFLGERFQGFHLFGIALIVAGIVLATRKPQEGN